MDIKAPPGALPYEALAAAYDLSGQSRFSLKMVRYVLDWLATRRIKPIRVVDLACGTGAAAVALARRRFAVVGIDGSACMLDRARCRAERWGVEVEWQQADLATLPERVGSGSGSPFDLALCLYDSLNHLTDPSDFRRALAGVRNLLGAGGHLCFDLATPHAYQSVWGDSREAHVGPSHARFWRSSYDAESGLATLETTYFVPGDAGAWSRLEACQLARGYSHEFVADALRDAGFELLDAFEALTFEPPTPEAYRVAYLARA